MDIKHFFNRFKPKPEISLQDKLNIGSKLGDVIERRKEYFKSIANSDSVSKDSALILSSNNKYFHRVKYTRYEVCSSGTKDSVVFRIFENINENNLSLYSKEIYYVSAELQTLLDDKFTVNPVNDTDIRITKIY